MSTGAGELVVETLDCDGARQVTAYIQATQQTAGTRRTRDPGLHDQGGFTVYDGTVT